MKTYKIEFKRAASLRKQLLWSNLAVFAITIAAGILAVGGAGDFALFLLLGIVGCAIWAVIAFWRALWALWEWPGIGIGLLAGFGTAILNVATGFLGSFASTFFLIYVYIQLGKQAGVAATKREVFEE